MYHSLLLFFLQPWEQANTEISLLFPSVSQPSRKENTAFTPLPNQGPQAWPTSHLCALQAALIGHWLGFSSQLGPLCWDSLSSSAAQCQHTPCGYWTLLDLVLLDSVAVWPSVDHVEEEWLSQGVQELCEASIGRWRKMAPR